MSQTSAYQFSWSELTPRARTEVSDRLWAALVPVGRRRQPTRGADVFGEYVLGVARRWRARRLDWSRAERIEARAEVLGAQGERAFDAAIAEARDRLMVSAGDASAVDEAFAVGYEALRRELGLSLHRVQVLAALAMHEGCCAELATGEGKTVTAILPAALAGWTGRGVHVITVNDYLARRDAETTRGVYKRLGLRVGVIQETISNDERREAYAADVTYSSDKQVIFDYLRDRLLAPLSPRLTPLLLDEVFGGGWRERGSLGLGDGEGGGSSAARASVDWSRRVVQRGLHAAIVDEADSVLVDDAVTPAIISGEAEGRESTNAGVFRLGAHVARELKEGEDYRVDRELRRVTLTEAGKGTLARMAESFPPFWAGPRRREELAQQALTAKELYRLGDDYVIRDGAIQLVDRSTGRILPGRQWQLGMHQAVEAKEGLAITPERRTTSRSSYQAFFQRYRRLAGMTGTAREVASELWRWYRLPVVRIPTHKPVIRVQHADRAFVTMEEKFKAVAERTIELHRSGRPVLVGTRSVTDSERVAALLRERGVECSVLNATREAEEAGIVARAGRAGAVTVSTNMAGRGTDIILDQAARQAGGLAVIATERHDEQRVDRQLFGRAGRQGDPGSAEAFVSLEDQLVQRAGPKLLRWLTAHASGAGRVFFARILWRVAQRMASGRWALMRAEAAKAEAWLDTAMHGVTR
jgi:preprotein translocase subunit SecA